MKLSSLQKRVLKSITVSEPNHFAELNDDDEKFFFETLKFQIPFNFNIFLSFISFSDLHKVSTAPRHSALRHLTQ